MNIGLPFRLCIYFACAPDEELTSKEVAEKFGTVVDGLNIRLREAVAAGYLRCQRGGGRAPDGRGQPSIYSAGPLLLRMLGREDWREAAK